MLALRAAESTRLCPRVGLWAGEEVALVLVEEAEEVVAESSSRWRLMDSCSSCSRRNRRSVRSRLWRGRLSRAEAPGAVRPDTNSVDMMPVELGGDVVNFWDGLPGPVVDWCTVFGVNARMLIVYDRKWAAMAGIGKLVMGDAGSVFLEWCGRHTQRKRERERASVCVCVLCVSSMCDAHGAVVLHSEMSVSRGQGCPQ